MRRYERPHNCEYNEYNVSTLRIGEYAPPGGCDLKRTIIALHQDEQGDWVADLECGHTQHVRHNPPWVERAWVTTPEGRQNRIGDTLDCRQCDTEG
jgi:Protein of unknown function (DUF3565)